MRWRFDLAVKPSGTRRGRLFFFFATGVNGKSVLGYRIVPLGFLIANARVGIRIKVDFVGKCGHADSLEDLNADENILNPICRVTLVASK
jgi:hypothetical protein